jgi:hypothetical protein
MMKSPDAVALEPWQIACLDQVVAAVRDELERGQLTCRLIAPPQLAPHKVFPANDRLFVSE